MLSTSGPHRRADSLTPQYELHDEPLTFDGSLFDGTAYDFDGPYCTAEYEVRYGLTWSLAGFHHTGSLRRLELIEEDFSQQYRWDLDGNLTRVRIFDRDAFEAEFKFESDGSLSMAKLVGDYFSLIPSRKEQLRFDIPLSKSFAKGLRASRTIYLSGSSLDDELLEFLATDDGLSEIEEVIVGETSLSELSLAALFSLPQLRRIAIRPEQVPIIQESRPEFDECEITVGGRVFNRSP